MTHEIIEKQASLSLCENPIPIDYSEVPEFTKEDYLSRIDALWALEQARQYSAIIVYGDREHFSNIHYLTGYDPRFEDSLLILKRGETPKILVGNEGMGYVRCVPYEIEIIMYQSFGLMGQPNDKRSKLLVDIFKDCRFQKDTRIGIVGWKTYDDSLFTTRNSITDIPNYIIETLSQVVGRNNLYNATDLFADNDYGLKHHLSAKEIVHFELNGTKISRKVYNTLKNLKEGMTEIEASQYLMIDGEPESNHPNVNFGDFNVSLGLRSPTYHQRLKLGDPAGVGFGMRGSLVHKSGMYIRSKEDLPDDRKNAIEDVVKPYFACVAAWYESMKIGTECGKIYDMVGEMLGYEKYHIGLNPGHLIHTDEWTNSPFVEGGKTKIRSGMGLQCDFTVSFTDPFITCHIEDGLVIADEPLQEEIRAISPSCYARITARQKYMREVLNINLPDEVLPMSDLPGVCFPYLADLSVILAKKYMQKTEKQ